MYQAVTGDVVIEAIDLSSGALSLAYMQADVSLPAGPGAVHWFTIPAVDATSTVLRAYYQDNVAGVTIAHNTILLAPPSKLRLQPTKLAVTYGPALNVDGTVDLFLTKAAGSPPAVFVTLTTLAQGRFSTNAFVMAEERVTVQFIPFGALDVALLKRSLRLETANQYA